MKEELIKRQLEELQLIQCSLLPTENLIFLQDSDAWNISLANHSEDPSGVYRDNSLNYPPSIAIRVDEAKILFTVTLADDDVATRGRYQSKILVSVKGEDISRAEHERWQRIVAEKMDEISDSDFPAYQLISLHLLPLLHEAVQKQSDSELVKTERESNNLSQLTDPQHFHALFTSHHLMSATKRRLLQQWSSSLSLNGFAKVGYPGVIYAQGERANVEEFVDNVKAMQWLALKVRFVEPIIQGEIGLDARTWKEFQKVGEVVEEMRRIGKEEYVVEMGIGSAGVNAKS